MTPGRAPCTSSNFSSRPPAACTMALKASLCALISSMTGPAPWRRRQESAASRADGGSPWWSSRGGRCGPERRRGWRPGPPRPRDSPPRWPRWAHALPLGHGREGIDMSLQQLELAQLPGKACQRRLQQGHLLTQGGGGGKGVHRQILCVCRPLFSMVLGQRGRQHDKPLYK